MAAWTGSGGKEAKKRRQNLRKRICRRFFAGMRFNITVRKQVSFKNHSMHVFKLCGIPCPKSFKNCTRGKIRKPLKIRAKVGRFAAGIFYPFLDLILSIQGRSNSPLRGKFQKDKFVGPNRRLFSYPGPDWSRKNKQKERNQAERATLCSFHGGSVWGIREPEEACCQGQAFGAYAPLTARMAARKETRP